MKNYKSIICIAAAVCLLGTAAFCGFRIYHHYAQVDEQTEAFEEIAEIVEQAPTEKTVPDDTPVSEGEDVLAKYQELYLQNEDMVGWISIAGTTINYPVMQSRNNPNFYLKHNFEKEYSDLGTPYVQENGDIVESENLVIYGHHIKGGKMFGALEDYKSKNFYEEHKTIQFDPSQSRQSMKSSLCLRLWPTVLRASDTMTLLMRRMRKILIPMSGSARSLLCMIQV